MKGIRRHLAFVVLVSLALAPCPVLADIVAQNLNPGTSVYGGFYVGESFITPSGQLYNNLSFNFYSYVAAQGTSNPQSPVPTATGTAFLLSREYTGTPANLGPSTPGFVAQSISSSNNVFLFDMGLTLLPGATYYLYGNATFPQVDSSAMTSSSGGVGYLATTGSFSNQPGPYFDFTLRGTAVPEPSTWALLGIGTAGVGVVVLRRRRVVA